MMTPGTEDFLIFDISVVQSVETTYFDEPIVSEWLDQHDVVMIKNYTLYHKDEFLGFSKEGVTSTPSDDQMTRQSEYLEALTEPLLVGAIWKNNTGDPQLMAVDENQNHHMLAFWDAKREAWILHKAYRHNILISELQFYGVSEIEHAAERMYYSKRHYDELPHNKGWMNWPMYTARKGLDTVHFSTPDSDEGVIRELKRRGKTGEWNVIEHQKFPIATRKAPKRWKDKLPRKTFAIVKLENGETLTHRQWRDRFITEYPRANGQIVRRNMLKRKRILQPTRTFKVNIDGRRDQNHNTPTEKNTEQTVSSSSS